MNYYYADSTNQPIGPISIDRLHALARDGIITSDTHVLPEESKEWQLYRSVVPPLPPSAGGLIATESNLSAIHTLPAIPTIATAIKTCPFCAEPIAAAAKKCKHCGETIDIVLRAAEEAKRASQHQSNVYMNAGGGVAVIAAAQKHNFPHFLHLVVTFLSVGVWFPIWLLHYLFRDRKYYY